MDTFIEGLGAVRQQGVVEILTSLGLSLVLGSMLATVYRWTHVGFSYSRSYVQTLVLASIVSTIMIVAIGNNLARGLGILGALAIIRFRTPIRDPRDIIFLFASLAVGISSGSGIYAVAVLGTVFFCLSVLVLSWSPNSTQRHNEGLLRFLAFGGSDIETVLSEVFKNYANSVELVAMREAAQGEGVEYAYQVQLVEKSLQSDFLNTLKEVDGLREVSFIMQRETVEI
ncbi:DUF4956 domain-containing protein [Pelagicoccus mobilis]|uniref:DUF4956 domain-containing protein n=1 Tax=Pelagicoccus mobilis TaxID=415221 RepID=A0A934RX16_9BACT|nr:DUF4956 domain-containing protein [Pelagicoccus mobilis]MBK1875952.1 DUF4956 domain-containing protein [Pelagicoccus mobilis]